MKKKGMLVFKEYYKIQAIVWQGGNCEDSLQMLSLGSQILGCPEGA